MRGGLSRTLLVAAWVGCGVLPLAAQEPARVTGHVLDAVSGERLAAAEVRLGDALVTTGPDGSFAFAAVSPGRAGIGVRRIGYAPSVRWIDVLPGLAASIEIQLQPRPVTLDSVTVVADAPGSISISGAELARRGGDLAQSLDGWAGISVRRTGSGGPAAPQVRGGGPDEVLVLLDGFPVNDPLTGRADLSRISSHDIARATLLPGAQSARLGARAIAGVIVLEGRSRFSPEVRAELASYGAGGGRVAGAAGRMSLSLEGERFAAAYPFRIPSGNGGGEGVRQNAGGWLAGGSLRWDGRLQAQARATLSHRGLPGIVTNPTPNATADDRTVFLGVRGGGRQSWSASLQGLDSEVKDTAPPAPFLPYSSRTRGVSLTSSAGLRRSFGGSQWAGDWGLGADARYDRFTGDAVRSGASFYQGGLRAEASVQSAGASTLRFAPVVRLDAWKGRAAPMPSVRLDLEWRRAGTTLTAAVGNAVSTPALIDLLFREGVGVRVNPDLRPERVRFEGEVGVTRSLRPGGVEGLLSLRGFAGRVADMVLWTRDFRNVWSPGNFDVVRRGGEASVSVFPLPALRLEAMATFAAVTYDRPGGAQVPYRPRITGAATAGWTSGVLDADVRWHYVGERFRDNSGVNARPPISIFDAGAGRRIGRILYARFDVHDLTDQRAEFIAGFPTPGRTFTLTLSLDSP